MYQSLREMSKSMMQWWQQQLMITQHTSVNVTDPAGPGPGQAAF